MGRRHKRHTDSLIKAMQTRFKKRDHFVGAEIGVWRGENSRALLKHFPNLVLHMVDRYQADKEDKNKRMSSLDQWEYDLALMNAFKTTEPYADRRTIHVGDSVYVANLFPENYFDFIFLDASHDYESVRRDLQAWSRLIVRGGYRTEEDGDPVKGGMIAGHDYGGHGDRTGVFGVKKAVDEFFGEDVVEVTDRGLVWWHLMEEL